MYRDILIAYKVSAQSTYIASFVIVEVVELHKMEELKLKHVWQVMKLNEDVDYELSLATRLSVKQHLQFLIHRSDEKLKVI